MEKTLAPPRPDRRPTEVRIARGLGAFLVLVPTAGFAALLAVWATAFPEVWSMVALLGLAAAAMVGLLVGFRRVVARVPDVRGIALRWAGFALPDPATWWPAHAALTG